MAAKNARHKKIKKITCIRLPILEHTIQYLYGAYVLHIKFDLLFLSGSILLAKKTCWKTCWRYSETARTSQMKSTKVLNPRRHHLGLRL